MEWAALPLRQIVGTLLLIALATGARLLVERALRRDGEFLSDQRRRILSNVKNGLFFIVAVGLVLIWAPSLRDLALSLTAFAVAIIIATKELILCLSGAFLRATTTPFRVGNWIEVGGIRGEVIDQNLLSVTVQEVYNDGRSYEYTGRTVVIPNSTFLTTAVKNENFYNRYVFHRFSVVMDIDIDPGPVEQAIVASLKESMEPYREVAQRYNSLIEHKAAVDIMGIEPYTRLETATDGRVRLEVTMFMPTKHAVSLEQAALQAGLAEIRRQRKALRDAAKLVEA